MNTDAADPSIVFVPERDQHRPASWSEKAIRVPGLALAALASATVEG